MNAKEALKAMLEGKKVTCAPWDAHHYIYFADDGKFRGEENEIYEWDKWTHEEGWSIFGAPKTYTRAEALKLLAEGKKISHTSWNAEYLSLLKDKIVDEDGNQFNWNDLVKLDGFIVKE